MAASPTPTRYLPLTKWRHIDMKKGTQGVPATVSLVQRAFAGRVKTGFFQFSGGFFV
jgi:hypothetical protein